MSERIAILTAGLLAEGDAKTAHGIIRFGRREVVAVVDARHAGARADDVVPYVAKPVPVVATVREARDLGAQVLVVGVAPAGGKLDPAWRAALLEAAELGLDLESGMHVQLGDDPEIAAAARRSDVELRELRLAPADLNVPAQPAARPPVRVVHSVGSDCAIGKMSVTLELDREAQRRGLSSAFVPTGQTGIAIAGWGIAVDHVVSDYIAGAADRLVRDGAAHGELLWVEGQGSLLHPAYSGVTLGLLHGSRPDVLLLCHRAGSRCIEDYPDTPIPGLAEVVELVERAAAWVSPAPVAAIALNTAELEDDAARAEIQRIEAETGILCDDVVRFGAGRTLDAVLGRLPPQR
jgi:D-glutamate N-acetyltransferase